MSVNINQIHSRINDRDSVLKENSVSSKHKEERKLKDRQALFSAPEHLSEGQSLGALLAVKVKRFLFP
jgi:hypothetical protein